MLARVRMLFHGRSPKFEAFSIFDHRVFQI